MKESASIRCKNLKKSYNNKIVLSSDKINFFGGGSTAIFGSNGSGKTTFLEMLTGNLDPCEGDVFFSHNRMTTSNHLLKRSIAYLPQRSVLPPWATCQNLLSYIVTLTKKKYEQEYLEKIISYWHCQDFKNKAIINCSEGMKKRIMLLLITFSDPKYLILDEPFSGLDYSHILCLERYLEKRNKDNKLTLLSTHMAPFAARLCSKAYHVLAGNVVEINSWQESDQEKRLCLIEDLFKQEISDPVVFNEISD
jgi:ABC-2 type transport system ATP-binding protein